MEKLKGTLIVWNCKRGYGIIRYENSLGVWSEFFCPARNIVVGDPIVGNEATFVPGRHSKRLPNAQDVAFSPKVEPATAATTVAVK
jgi:hypothetical protein